MRLKSFTAESLREAMEAVRLELGEEAIIVDTEERPGFVRLMAAIDPENAQPEPPPRLRRAPMAEPTQRPPAPAAAPLPTADDPWPEEWPVGPAAAQTGMDGAGLSADATGSLMNGILREARAAGRDAVWDNGEAPAPPRSAQARTEQHRARAQSAVAEQASTLPPGEAPGEATSLPATPTFRLPDTDQAITPEQVVDVVYDALRDQGVPALIGEEVLDLVSGYETNDPHRALAATLREMFRFRPIDGNRPEKSLMLVGPPGAGKSRVAAKLAARALITGERPALITVDTDRLGAAAALHAFADAMGQPLLEADTPEGLGGALVTTHQADLVVIDTPGCNHLSDAEMVGLGRFAIATPLEPVAVVPAGIDPIEAADIGHAFADLGAERLIIARVDAARRVGSILAAAYDAGLALAEFSATPRIKDGLTVVDPMRLAQLLMPPRRGSEWPHHSRYTADDGADPPRRTGSDAPSARRRRSS